jgi:hypothetical protein
MVCSPLQIKAKTEQQRSYPSTGPEAVNLKSKKHKYFPFRQ